MGKDMKLTETILRRVFGWTDKEFPRDESWGEAMLVAALFCLCVVALFLVLAVL